MTGWLFDIYSAEHGMILWMISAEGERIPLTLPYRPSFFVDAPPRVMQRVKAALEKSKLPVSISVAEQHDFWSGDIRTVLRISSVTPHFQALVKRISRIDGAELFNCDIVPEQLFFYESGLFPLAFCEFEASEGVIHGIRALNSPWDRDYSLPPLSIMKLIADTNGANPNYGAKNYPLRVEVDGSEYLLENDELLETLEKMLLRDDPDVILTEWGDSFIIPRLLHMARMQKKRLSFNRDVQRDITTRRGASYFSYGRIVYRAPAQNFFGRWHIDVENSFIASETGLDGLFELARLTKIPVQRLARTSPGTGISSMQLDMAVREDILIPWRKRMPEDFKSALELLVTDKGGLVYLPKPGIYDAVMEIDFASMYPAIMVNHNISPETINCPCCKGVPVPEIGHHVCGKRRGLVPKVLDPILEKRRLYKEMMKQAGDAAKKAIYKQRQTALKWVLVTCFGYLGYKNARFGRIEAHEAVTALGREKLLQAKEIAEQKGFRFLHAIVDSLWVQKDGMTEANQNELLQAISEAVGITIALEGNYRWIAFVPSRTAPRVAVANRYFGLFDTGEMKLRGLEIRRSDMPPIVKSMQAEMLQVLMGAANSEEFLQKEVEIMAILQKYLARVMSGKVLAEELVISRKMSKNPADYKTNTAMATASQALAAAGVDPQPGERVDLIIVDSHAKDQVIKAIPYTPAIEKVDKYDVEQYAELLIRATETILLREIGRHEVDQNRQLHFPQRKARKKYEEK
jgi:DNA polymerase elongation subunit (family B)